MAVLKRPSRPGPEDLLLLQQEIKRLFERMGLDLERPDRAAGAEWAPSIDVFECDGKVTVVVEAPGLVPDSLRVAWREGHLTVSGERRERKPAGVVAFLCMERPHGRFSRTIALDLPLDVRQAHARLSGGILTIVIPRLKDRRGRETVITVEGEEEA